jgi:serine/threonine protein kinase
LTINQAELKNEKNDNEKLCKAWIVPITEIEFKEVIGMGAFGEVRRGEWRGLDVAFKKMFPENMEDLGYDLMHSLNTVSTEGYSNNSTATPSSTTFPNTIGVDKLTHAMLNNDEIGVMMRLRHPRIVTFLGAGEVIDPPMEGDDVPRVGIFVMLEYAPGGDLIHRLKNAAGSITLFPWVDRIQCALDIAEGMVYIHSEGFIHRDLKSLNILCDKNNNCMIADLGLTCSNVRPPTIELGDDYEDDGETKVHSSVQFNKHVPIATDSNYNTAWQGTAGKIVFCVFDVNNDGVADLFFLFFLFFFCVSMDGTGSHAQQLRVPGRRLFFWDDHVRIGHVPCTLVEFGVCLYPSYHASRVAW